MNAPVSAPSLGGNERLGLRDIMSRVRFSAEQMSRICGVSRRQLSYWTKKGILSGDDGYSLTTLEKVLLIKQELDNKASLRRAVQKAEGYLERRSAEASELGAMSDQSLRVMVAERLEQLQLSARASRQYLLDLSADDEGVHRLAAELENLQLEKVFQAPSAGVTLPALATRLGLAVERMERSVAYLHDRVVAKA